MFLDQSCNAACRNVPSLAALCAKQSSEPSKVSVGTAECLVLVLNDMKTVKALPSLDFWREEEADAGVEMRQGRIVGRSEWVKGKWKRVHVKIEWTCIIKETEPALIVELISIQIT